jgi:hypothetical protein
MAAKCRIMRQYHGKDPAEIPEVEARERLGWYYPLAVVRQILRDMWNENGRIQYRTFGAWYWIER